jgi:hypothetical protein
MAMKITAGPGNEMSAAQVRAESRSVLKMPPGCLGSCFRRHAREHRQKNHRQNLHKFAF